QYWGQEVLLYPADPLYKRAVNSYHLDNINDFIAELTPLSQISDEDAMLCGFDNSKHFLDVLQEYRLTSINVDRLRLKGYALPWMGISVEEQITRGWVKLKTN